MLAGARQRSCWVRAQGRERNSSHPSARQLQAHVRRRMELRVPESRANLVDYLHRRRYPQAGGRTSWALILLLTVHDAENPCSNVQNRGVTFPPRRDKELEPDVPVGARGPLFRASTRSGSW